MTKVQNITLLCFKRNHALHAQKVPRSTVSYKSAFRLSFCMQYRQPSSKSITECTWTHHF